MLYMTPNKNRTCLEELPDLFLRPAHVLVQHLWPVHNLGLARVKDFANGARDERLAAPGRAY